MLKLLKRIAPVGIGILLILLITVTVSLVKNANDRTPSINNADEVYVSYDNQLSITNEKLYTLMKNQYGLTELLNMIDSELFKDEVEKLDVNSEEYISFVKEQIFQVEDMSELEADEAQEKWDEIIDSLQITGQLTKAQAEDNDYTKENSEVWKVVKDYYKLSYVREEWAKDEYIKKYLEKREDGNMFDMTKAENATLSIEQYFEDNYTGKVSGLFIPFTSEEAALKLMAANGINTLDKVLSANDGWVSSTYDYYTKAEVEESDMLTYQQVVEAFFSMYNTVYGYLNSNNPIITDDSYTSILKEENTVQAVILAMQKAMEDKKYGVSVKLPTTATVRGQEDATITWSVNNEKYGKIEENVVYGDFKTTDDGEVEIKLNFEVSFKEVKSSGSITITLNGKLNEETDKYESPENTIEQIDAVTVDPFFGYEFTEEFLNSVNENFKFSWTEAEATEINATLADYLTVDSTKLKLSTKPSEVYKSYTIEPVKVGNYYFLILKLADYPQTELFEKTSDGENAKDENGKYIIADQELYDIIVAKMTEDLLTDNAINEMLYEKRQAHNVQFFDAYLEALYEYEYNYFYQTTLKANEFDEYKKSKKNQKSVVVSFQLEAGNKKNVKKFEAQDLYNRLEPKYASSSVASLIENYILISDKKYNDIYNPYTGEIYNETSYKNLMNSEISTLRKNFESDYFTYSYLSYYGFIPNFPAKYGWKKFIKDYFVVDSDQELLTTSTYGGSIYTDALNAYIDANYTLDEVYEAIQKDYEEAFGVSVINLLVTIDYNYNADSASKEANAIIMEESENWRSESELAKKQAEYAVELLSFMYQVANETNQDTLYNQLNAVVTLYNNAPYEYNETTWNEAKANNTSIYDYNYFGKYKLLGLNVTVEKANQYTNTNEGIAEPFLEKAKDLWTEIKDLGLLGKTLDAPLVSDEAFLTDFGYHQLAAVSTAEKDELPTKDQLIQEMEIHRAQALVDAVVTEIETVEENIESYKESGYDISSYEAEKAVLEAKLAKLEKELNAVLAKYDLEEGYELDEEAAKRIETWYTPVEKEIEGGTLVTRSYIKALQDNAAKIKFTNNNGSAKLAEFLELLLEQCDKTDAE